MTLDVQSGQRAGSGTTHLVDEQHSDGDRRPVIELTKAWKMFGHVTALRDVDLTAMPGEVLAIVGDNGAGKSTLIKVLSGVHSPDRGELRIGGQVVHQPDPALVRELGVSAVFQDLAVVEPLDIATNMFLGRPLTKMRVFTDRRRMIAEAASTLQQLKVRLPSVRVPIGLLSGGQRQGVAIARAVHEDNPIILMDEPTAALGVRETAQVGAMIAELRARNKAVLLVSHDLPFVLEFADRVQVMRLGEVRAVRRIAEVDRDQLVGLITGSIEGDRVSSDDR